MFLNKLKFSAKHRFVRTQTVCLILTWLPAKHVFNKRCIPVADWEMWSFMIKTVIEIRLSFVETGKVNSIIFSSRKTEIYKIAWYKCKLQTSLGVLYLREHAEKNHISSNILMILL